MEDERCRSDDAPAEGEPSQGVEDAFGEEREEGRPPIHDDARPPMVGGGWAGVDRGRDAESDGDEEERRAERHRPTGMDEDVAPVDHRDRFGRVASLRIVAMLVRPAFWTNFDRERPAGVSPAGRSRYDWMTSGNVRRCGSEHPV